MQALLCLALAGSAVAADRYGMEDLKALEKQGSWRELLDHAMDILPSKRDAEWSRLVEKSAIGLLDETKPEEHNPMAGYDTAEQLMKTFPSLRTSQPFLQKRAAVGIDSFKHCRFDPWCSKSDNDWREKLLAFAKTDPGNVALPAADMQMRYLTAAVALPLFELALGDKAGSPVCKNPALHKSVLEALEWNEWFVKDAQHVAFEQCWDTLKPELLKRFDTTQKQKGYLKTTCEPLTQKKALSAAQAKRCVHDDEG